MFSLLAMFFRGLLVQNSLLLDDDLIREKRAVVFWLEYRTFDSNDSSILQNIRLDLDALFAVLVMKLGLYDLQLHKLRKSALKKMSITVAGT